MRISRRNLQRLVERYLLNEQDVNTGETKSKEAYEALEKELLKPGFSMNGFVLKFLKIKTDSKILNILDKKLEDNVYLKFTETSSRPIKLDAYIPKDEDASITPGGSDEQSAKEWEEEELTKIKSNFTDEEIKEIIEELSTATIDFSTIQSIQSGVKHVFSSDATKEDKYKIVYGYYQPPEGYEGMNNPDAEYLNDMNGEKIIAMLHDKDYEFYENANGAYVKIMGVEAEFELYYDNNFESRIKKLKDIKIEELRGVNYIGTAGNGNKTNALEKVLNIDLQNFVETPSSEIVDQVPGDVDIDDDDPAGGQENNIGIEFSEADEGTYIMGNGDTAPTSDPNNPDSIIFYTSVLIDSEKAKFFDRKSDLVKDVPVAKLSEEEMQSFLDKKKDDPSSFTALNDDQENTTGIVNGLKLKNPTRSGKDIITHVTYNGDNTYTYWGKSASQKGSAGLTSLKTIDSTNQPLFDQVGEFMGKEGTGDYLDAEDMMKAISPGQTQTGQNTSTATNTTTSTNTTTATTSGGDSNQQSPSTRTKPTRSKGGGGSQNRAAKKGGKATDWDSYISKTKDKENAKIIKLLWQGVEGRADSAGKAAGKTTDYKDFVRWYMTLYKTGSIRLGYKIQPGTQIGKGKAWNPGQHLHPKQVQMILRQLSSGEYKTSGLAKPTPINESLSRGSLYRKHYYGRY